MRILIFLALLGFQATAKTVRYELRASRGSVNLSGKKTVDFALMINGQIPAPTLEFTEGDDAEITLINDLDEEVSTHWHGLLLPPQMDGVPYMNTPPIMPGQRYTFKFKIRQHGTYWYHSHTMVQEQKGLYGAFIIHPKKPTIEADKEAVVMINDWSDEDADQILRNLRKDGEYYMYKKGSVRSWWGALRNHGLKTYVGNQWSRMGDMDLSDVGYDAFLINGKRDSVFADAKPGDEVRIRLINASSSSYVHVNLGQKSMHVISADGHDIEPVMTKDILLGMAETYDVLYTVPENNAVELRATAQDGSGYASLWFGKGEKIPARDMPKPDLYMAMDHMSMDHMQMDHASMAHMQMVHMNHQMVESLTVDGLKSPSPTNFPKEAPTHDLKLVLGGDMNRYVWHINGKAIYQDRFVNVKEGEIVRMTFQNDTMMHHPMHLHGHFFRVLNKNGDYSPLKHTVDVPPHGTRVIEFRADEPGDWMLHCHNTYHMMTGMGRFLHYEGYKPTAESAAHAGHDPHLHDHLYTDGLVEAATNHAQGRLRFSKTWDTLEGKVDARAEDGDRWSWDGDVFYRRWLGNNLNLVAGGTSYEGLQRGVLGVGYILPMMIHATGLVNHEGKFRLDLEKHIQWTKYVFSEIEVNFRQDYKTEFELSLMYANHWSWSAGLVLTEHKLGAGAQYKF